MLRVNRHPPWLVPVVAFAVGVGLLLPAAAQADDRALPITADTLATGVVERAGVPVKGAVVTFALWPEQDGWSSGQHVDGAKIVPKTVVPAQLGKATTDANGRFAFRSPLSNSRRAGYAMDGANTIQTTVTAGSDFMLFTFVSRGVNGHWQSATGPDGAPTDLFYDVGEQSDAFVTTNKVAGAASVGKTTLTAGGAHPDGACLSQVGPIYIPYGARYYPRQETFAYIYGTADTKGDIQHSTSSLHNLGMGIQYVGHGWTAGGEYGFYETWESSQESGYLIDASVRSALYMQQYQMYMIDEYDGSHCRYMGLATKANGTYDSISGTSTVTSKIYAYRVSYAKCNNSGETIYIATTYGRQATYSVGLAGPFISTSTSAGWGTSDRQVWAIYPHRCDWWWINDSRGPSYSKLWSFSDFAGKMPAGTKLAADGTWSDEGLPATPVGPDGLPALAAHS